MFHVEHLTTFGKRLRVARLGALERVGRELSQTALAEIVSLSPQAVSAWEADRTAPPIEVIEALALALGVTPGWLAFGQEPRYPAEVPREAKPTGSTIVERGTHKKGTRKRTG